MSYRVPDFVLPTGFYNHAGPYDVPREITEVNLAFGRRIQLALPLGGELGSGTQAMTLLVHAGFDVRDTLNAGGEDFVECPFGSGRWYVVLFVDDIGKGFPNEHRAAVIQKIGHPVTGDPWPTPIP